MRILSVDWDFFFPEHGSKPGAPDRMMYDWTSAESPLYIEALWPTRAEAFVRRNLLLPGMSGEQNGFWKRFRFRKNCRVYVSESHASMISLANRLQHIPMDQISVTSFDAHHDGGYHVEDQRTTQERQSWHCGNWAVYYQTSGAKVHVVYPRWKSWAKKIEGRPQVKLKRSFDTGEDFRLPFDAIFICRSGAWVPSWTDSEWTKFLADCPVQDRVELLPAKERRFDLKAVLEEVVRMNTWSEFLKTVVMKPETWAGGKAETMVANESSVPVGEDLQNGTEAA